MLFPAVGIFVCLSSLAKAQYLQGLEEGEVCADKPEGQSICMPFEQCTHVDMKTVRPAICSFRGRDPIVCCPSKLKMGKAETSCLGYILDVPCPIITKPGGVQIAVVGGNLSESKTQRHMRQVTEEPDLVLGITGGQPSPNKTQRAMALIGYGPMNNIEWRCGGSLVSDIWVLSAAHCTTTSDLGLAKWARLGELDHSTNTDDARPQDRRIVQRINHPEYKSTLKYNDIALYKLESRVLYDQFIAPVCLHTTYEIDQSKATVVGWGRTDFADDLSSRLMEVDITLINNTECRRLYGNGDDTTPRGIDQLSMLCAGEKEGGKDACTGDSGGPLVVNQANSCLKKLVGITSFGRDCGRPNTPGIYTRVSSYVPWIESFVWP